MLFEMCYHISRLLLLTCESSPTDCRPTKNRSTVGRRSNRPSTDSSSESIPTVGRPTVANCQSTVGRCIDQRSVDTSVDSRPTVDQRELKYTWSDPFIILNYLIYYRGTNNVSVCLTGKKHYVIRSIIFLLLNQDG